MIKVLIALVHALPQILELVKLIQEQQKKSEENRKVKEDIEKINQAFKDQDAKALNEIFNNKPSRGLSGPSA